MRSAGPGGLRLRPPGAVGAGRGGAGGPPRWCAAGDTHAAVLREILCCVSSNKLLFS